MLAPLLKILGKWLWQIILSGSALIFFIYSFYNEVESGIVIFIMLFFTLTVVIYIDHVTKTLSKYLVNQFKNPIKTNIEKTLVIQKEGHRLSQLELNNIGSEAIKGLEIIIKNTLRSLLYRFSLGVIFVFVILILALFRQPPFNDVIQYVLHGECKPISVTK
jgi:hypothetical protein